VVTARSGERLGAGTTVTVPAEPADGLISSARGGGSTCREKLLREVGKCLLGDWITIGDADTVISFARGVLELRLAASAAGMLLEVKVVEWLRSAGVGASPAGRVPA